MPRLPAYLCTTFFLSDFGRRFRPSVEGGLLELLLSFATIFSYAAKRSINFIMSSSFSELVIPDKLGIGMECNFCMTERYPKFSRNASRIFSFFRVNKLRKSHR